jgi:hypothetical protein
VLQSYANLSVCENSQTRKETNFSQKKRNKLIHSSSRKERNWYQRRNKNNMCVGFVAQGFRETMVLDRLFKDQETGMLDRCRLSRLFATVFFSTFFPHICIRIQIPILLNNIHSIFCFIKTKQKNLN